MTATHRSSRARRQQGRAQLFMLVLLLALGAGGWNYAISYRADLESHRDLPFAAAHSSHVISFSTSSFTRWSGLLSNGITSSRLTRSCAN